MSEKSIILIPARKGSTRVKNKNLQLIESRTLLSISIETALESNCGRVIVSTNCPEIAKHARECGADVPFLRDESISTSTATSLAVILNALDYFEKETRKIPRYIIFKPPTNPFLKATSIASMLKLKEENLGYDSVLSIFRPRTCALNFVSYEKHSAKITPEIYEVNGHKLYDFERSQDRPKSYAGSAACKITSSAYFANKYGFSKKSQITSEGPTYNINSCLGFEISQAEAFDIDTSADLELAKAGSRLFFRHDYLAQTE